LKLLLANHWVINCIVFTKTVKIIVQQSRVPTYRESFCYNPSER